MRDALPKAAFIGFAGTPLIKTEEEKTREVFGDYVSIYNFTQSLQDGATAPLYYENRIPEVQLTNEQLNQDMERLLDKAMLDQAQEEKLEREFSRKYQIITREDRLEKIAADMVAHFIGRGHRGKAMFVAIDKAIAVKMYDKAQKYWKKYLADLHKRSRKLEKNLLKKDALNGVLNKIKFMEETDMAVVISQSQNEVEDLAKKGAKIFQHRRRMIRKDLDKKFKDADDPFRIVFVCAMWMTGFDVPSCSTIYLDKPMRNHTLMQTIARANRVWKDKTNGLIVDYVGVFRNLERALAIYGAPTDAKTDFPIKNKKELKKQLKIAIDETENFLKRHDIDLAEIIETEDVYQQTKKKEEAVERILISENSKKEFLN